MAACRAVPVPDRGFARRHRQRWTILTRREAGRFGSRKFQEFERGLPGISPNTLSARLKRLEEAGIIERRFYEQHPPRAEYVLTE